MMHKTVGMRVMGALTLGLLTTGVTHAADQPQKDLSGPTATLQRLQDTGKILFKLADENDDNQISQKEAIDAGNMLVGGFFFRADTNGDGILSQEEARAAGDEFLKDHPWARYAVETIKADKQGQGAQGNKNNQPTNNDAANALQSLSTAFDTNNDKQLQATELRQAVQTTVQGLFASADTNRDGQLSPSEVNAAIAGGARAIAQAAFQQADSDKDGALSEGEFDQSLKQPTHVLFTLIDLNHDGKISQEEMQQARRGLLGRLEAMRVPEPANSPRHLIESGRKPSEVSPVPTFGTPTPNRNQPAQSNTRLAPAPAPAPAATAPAQPQ